MVPLLLDRGQAHEQADCRKGPREVQQQDVACERRVVQGRFGAKGHLHEGLQGCTTADAGRVRCC